MHIAYVTTYDACDVRNWSGLGYYIAQALSRQGMALDYYGPLRQRWALLFKGKQFIYRHVLHQRHRRDREPFILWDYARQITRCLQSSPADIVFSPGSIPIAHLECQQPIVFWTDATFAAMVDYYPTYSHLSAESIRQGNEAEQRALEHCRLAIYSSEWAARSAIAHYSVAEEKIRVVPFGANLECTRCTEDIETLIAARPRTPYKLLFLGVNWERKGGAIALAVAKELNRSGLPTELSIVGCPPITDEALPPFVKVLGFISKMTPVGMRRLEQLLSEAHFLIVPSRAECSAIVFCEANSFGVPCLSTRVGGTPEIIRDGVNGQTFERDAPISAYCAFIADVMSDYTRYQELALSSFGEYQARLNWDVAGQRIKALLEEIL